MRNKHGWMFISGGAGRTLGLREKGARITFEFQRLTRLRACIPGVTKIEYKNPAVVNRKTKYKRVEGERKWQCL